MARTEKERFLQLIEHVQGDCWEWHGNRKPDGYGRFAQEYAHRAAWRIWNGAIPDGLFCCHKCDNPRCVNPFHLFLGTHADNLRDLSEKGYAGKINAAQVRDLRAAYDRGEKIGPLAAQMGISYSNALRIAKRKARRHVIS